MKTLPFDVSKCPGYPHVGVCETCLRKTAPYREWQPVTQFIPERFASGWKCDARIPEGPA